MKQEIPSAPSAKEEPEYALRIQEIRGIAQGKRTRQKSRKARQRKGARMQEDPCGKAAAKDGGCESLKSAGVATGSQSVGHEEEAYGEFDQGNLAESWDELFGLADKEQERPSSNIRFLDALRGIGESGFAQRSQSQEDCSKRFSDNAEQQAGGRSTEAFRSRPQDSHGHDAADFDAYTTGSAADGYDSCLADRKAQGRGQRGAQETRRQEETQASARHAASRVRPPQKRKRVYVTQSEPVQRLRFTKVVAISASTSLLVSIAVALATGAAGPEMAFAQIAGWSL